MTRAEFEEREFETPLYHQLKVGAGSVWSPGQVLEQHVGFDLAMFCVDSYFWAVHGMRGSPDGFLLGELLHRRFWRRRNLDRPLPDFALNLFLQAKRPEVRKRLSKQLKNSTLVAPYWRFSVDVGQQSVLEALSHATNGRALVCYAAPAFDRLSQLYAHTVQGTIVENSTFPKATSLSGHDAWNYDKPGAVGIANATPRQIEDMRIEDQIDALLLRNSNTREGNYDSNLRDLVTSIDRITEERFSEVPTRIALYHQRVAEVDSLMKSIEPSRYLEAVRNYLKVLAFADAHQIQWYALGRKE